MTRPPLPFGSGPADPSAIHGESCGAAAIAPISSSADVERRPLGHAAKRDEVDAVLPAQQCEARPEPLAGDRWPDRRRHIRRAVLRGCGRPCSRARERSTGAARSSRRAARGTSAAPAGARSPCRRPKRRAPRSRSGRTPGRRRRDCPSPRRGGRHRRPRGRRPARRRRRRRPNIRDRRWPGKQRTEFSPRDLDRLREARDGPTSWNSRSRTSGSAQHGYPRRPPCPLSRPPRRLGRSRPGPGPSGRRSRPACA